MNGVEKAVNGVTALGTIIMHIVLYLEGYKITLDVHFLKTGLLVYLVDSPSNTLKY